MHWGENYKTTHRGKVGFIEGEWLRNILRLMYFSYQVENTPFFLSQVPQFLRRKKWTQKLPQMDSKVT